MNWEILVEALVENSFVSWLSGMRLNFSTGFCRILHIELLKLGLLRASSVKD